MNPKTIVRAVVHSFQEHLTSVLSEVAAQPLEPERFRRLLRDLRTVSNEAGREAFVRTVEAMDEPAETLRRGDTLYRCKLSSEKEWLTPFGKVRVSRRYYQPDAGGEGFAPLDERCGMTDRYLTPDVEEWTAMASATLVPREVEALLGKLLPEGPSKTTVDDVIEELGSYAEAHTEQIEAQIEKAAPVSQEGEYLVVGWDGVNVPLREEAPKRGRPPERPTRGDTARSPTAWKEAGVGVVSVYRTAWEADKPPERVDGRYFARMPEKGMATLLSQIVRQTECVLANGPFVEHALICDGKRDIWRAADRYAVFEGFTRILDFYHAAQGLSKAAEAIFGKQSGKGQQWYRTWRKKLKGKAGAARGVLRSMRGYLKTLRKGTDRYKALGEVIRYVRNNLDKMDYANYRARGLPIGSGPVEAACKTVVAHRLKRSGMRWSRPGGQQVLNLRSLLLSDRWDAFWNAYQQKDAA